LDSAHRETAKESNRVLNEIITNSVDFASQPLPATIICPPVDVHCACLDVPLLVEIKARGECQHVNADT